MLRTLYAAAPFETPFSLLIALAATTTDQKCGSYVTECG